MLTYELEQLRVVTDSVALSEDQIVNILPKIRAGSLKNKSPHTPATRPEPN